MENSRKQRAAGLGLVSNRRLVICILAWLFSASVTSVVGEWTHYCTNSRYSAQGMCGSRLAESLSVICQMFGGYNSRSFGKRSVSPSKPLGDLDHADSPFLSKSRALSYLHVPQKRLIVTRRSHSHRQGIVCECCVHKCGLRELYEYCADPEVFGVSKRRALPPTHQADPFRGQAHLGVPAATVDDGANSERAGADVGTRVDGASRALVAHRVDDRPEPAGDSMATNGTGPDAAQAGRTKSMAGGWLPKLKVVLGKPKDVPMPAELGIRKEHVPTYDPAEDGQEISYDGAEDDMVRRILEANAKRSNSGRRSGTRLPLP